MSRWRALFLRLGEPKTVGMIFLLGLAIRLAGTAFLGNRLLPLADQPVFLDLGENISSGKGLVISPELVGIPQNVSESEKQFLWTRPERVRDERLGALWGIIRPNTPTAFFEPFYPLFVGGVRYLFGPTSGTGILGSKVVLPFGPKIYLVRLCQSLFDALVILLLFYLGRALFAPVVGGLAALIYCFYPHAIIFTLNIATQNTYLFLQALMVFFFMRTLDRQTWANYLLLGLTAGLTLLTRISLITFIPFIVICLYLPLRNKLKWARLAISMLIMIATVVPWVLRNQAVFGEALLLPTKGGRNLWEYNNQIFTLEKMNPGLWLQQQYEQLSFDSLRISALEKANRPERAGGIDLLYQNLAQKNFPTLRAKEVLEFPQFTTETEVERDRMLNHNVKKFILQNPRIYVQLCGLRLYQLFRVTPRHLGGPLATAAAWCSIGWILPASFLGLFLSFKQWRRRSVLYALIFYTVATHTLTASGIPHRVPTDPYFILFAAFFIAKMLKLYAVEGEVSNAISNR